MQLQQALQQQPQNMLQQTLQKFREDLLEEMNQRLAPYPPLSRNNGNHGEQANEGQHHGRRGENPQYGQYWGNSAPY